MTPPRLGRGETLTRIGLLGAAALSIAAVLFAFFTPPAHRAARGDASERRDPPAAYRHGDALAYLPQTCPAYRVYVDVKTLWGAIGTQELMDAARRAKPTADVIAAFDAAGIDPRRDVQDLAFCGLSLAAGEDERGHLVMAMGGALGGDRALDRYKAVVVSLSHVDPRNILEEKSGGVRYLVSKLRKKHVWIAMPAPDVLVFSTEDVSLVEGLGSRHAIADAWEAETPWAAAFELGQAGPGAAVHMSGRVSVQGPDVAVDAVLRHGALAGLDAAKLETIRHATVDVLDRSALKELSPSVRDMTVSLADGELHARLAASGATWGHALQEIDERPSVVRSILAELTRRPGE